MWPSPKNSKAAKDNVPQLLKEFNLEHDVRYGKTKVFLRSPKTIFELEKRREEKIPDIVVFLQKVWRGTLARRSYKKLKAANTIFKFYRFYHARSYVRQLNSAFRYLNKNFKFD